MMRNTYLYLLSCVLLVLPMFTSCNEDDPANPVISNVQPFYIVQVSDALLEACDVAVRVTDIDGKEYLHQDEDLDWVDYGMEPVKSIVAACDADTQTGWFNGPGCKACIIKTRKVENPDVSFPMAIRIELSKKENFSLADNGELTQLSYYMRGVVFYAADGQLRASGFGNRSHHSVVVALGKLDTYLQKLMAGPTSLSVTAHVKNGDITFEDNNM